MDRDRRRDGRGGDRRLGRRCARARPKRARRFRRRRTPRRSLAWSDDGANGATTTSLRRAASGRDSAAPPSRVGRHGVTATSFTDSSRAPLTARTATRSSATTPTALAHERTRSSVDLRHDPADAFTISSARCRRARPRARCTITATGRRTRGSGCEPRARRWIGDTDASPLRSRLGWSDRAGGRAVHHTGRSRPTPPAISRQRRRSLSRSTTAPPDRPCQLTRRSGRRRARRSPGRCRRASPITYTVDREWRAASRSR